MLFTSSLPVLVSLASALTVSLTYPEVEGVIEAKKKTAKAKQPAVIYFIRHGEKDDNSGEDLDAQGYKRASCLATTAFGGKSPRFPSPKRIIAQGDHSSRSPETLTPLAKSLGLTIDQSCGRDDISCACDLIKQSSLSPVIIAWEHKELSSIVECFTSDGSSPDYPGANFDLVWIVDAATQSLKEDTEACPGLDDGN